MSAKKSMNKLFQMLSILAVLALFTTACGAQVVQAQPADRPGLTAAAYATVLGKSLNDQEVADFIVRNNCSTSRPLHTCHTAGMALWVGQGQKVEAVVLYPNEVDDFEAYKGELPLGLSSDDTMAGVEDKFGHPKVEYIPQAGWEPRLSDETGTPDHIHYWATYKHFGVTVIYNSPSGSDKSATIYAILVNK